MSPYVLTFHAKFGIMGLVMEGMSIRRLFAAIVLAASSAGVLVQAGVGYESSLVVLPFLGGAAAGEGDEVAAFLSASRDIRSAFRMIDLSAEIRAEAAGLDTSFIDADAIAAVGRTAGSDLVLSGQMRQHGNSNIIVAHFVETETGRLVAGFHADFRNNRELRILLPDMATRLALAITESPAADGLPSLAVSPIGFAVEGRVAETADPQAVDTIAQILAIEIANAGRHAVLPRHRVMRAAVEDWERRTALLENDGDLAALLGQLLDILDGPIDISTGGMVTAAGRAAESDYVLSVEPLGDGSFAVRILRTETAEPVASVEVGETPHDTAGILPIASLLADPDSPEAVAAILRRQRVEAVLGDPTRFWGLGFSVGTTLGAPRLVGTAHVSLAPMPSLMIRLGCDMGFISDLVGIADYVSFYPFAHAAFLLPFWWGSLYAGAGGGVMISRYNFDGLSYERVAPLADISVGLILANGIELSYALRTDFSSFNSKISVGYTFRIRPGVGRR